jgi:hypothetical protein
MWYVIVWSIDNKKHAIDRLKPCAIEIGMDMVILLVLDGHGIQWMIDGWLMDDQKGRALGMRWSNIRSNEYLLNWILTCFCW